MASNPALASESITGVVERAIERLLLRALVKLAIVLALLGTGATSAQLLDLLAR